MAARKTKATGGRVKKFGGGGPGKVGPKNIKAPSQRKQSTLERPDPRGRPRTRSAPETARRMPRPPGYKKGGRVSKAKGGKAKK